MVQNWLNLTKLANFPQNNYNQPNITRNFVPKIELNADNSGLDSDHYNPTPLQKFHPRNLEQVRVFLSLIVVFLSSQIASSLVWFLHRILTIEMVTFLDSMA